MHVSFSKKGAQNQLICVSLVCWPAAQLGDAAWGKTPLENKSTARETLPMRASAPSNFSILEIQRETRSVCKCNS